MFKPKQFTTLVRVHIVRQLNGQSQELLRVPNHQPGVMAWLLEIEGQSMSYDLPDISLI